MKKRHHTIIALANRNLRIKLERTLHSLGFTAELPRDLHEVVTSLAARDRILCQEAILLVLDEAFIFPDVYEECAHIKAASQQTLTIVLLVEPRTRTRSDWMGADHILRLPMQASEIANHALAVLRAKL